VSARHTLRLALAAAFLAFAAAVRAESNAPAMLVSTQQNFTFFLCGDNRNGDGIYLQILDAVAKSNAAFLVNTGDLVLHGADENWDHFAALMKNCPAPFFPVAGNHDVGMDGMKGFERFTPTHTAHYSFDYGQLHFTMANDAMDMTREELAWIEADLKATTLPVKIVVHHKPSWNTEDPDGTVYGMHSFRKEFLALLEKYHVRYEFCGHDHGFRTGVRNGTTLIVSGGAGAGLYHEANEGGFHHYVAFHVSGTNVSFQAVPVGSEQDAGLQHRKLNHTR
jgi:3',5'-cyclic AMP phosphodiesterase CpdA